MARGPVGGDQVFEKERKTTVEGWLVAACVALSFRMCGVVEGRLLFSIRGGTFALKLTNNDDKGHRSTTKFSIN